MKRDLRLLPKRYEVDRDNYIEDVAQHDADEKIDISKMVFENCIDQIEGELSYRHVDPKQYDIYLSDSKEKSNGNLWKYLWYVQRLYEGNFLSSTARKWNLDLLRQSQNFWFQWVRSVPYPGIQGYCLSYSPSLDCLIDYLKYLGNEDSKDAAGEENNSEQDQILVILLIQTFILQMTAIEGNMESDNRIYVSTDRWNIDKWKKEESSAYIRDFIEALLNIPSTVLHPVLFAVLSEEWIFEKKVLRDIYRKKIRDAFLEILAERYNKELPDIIKSELWGFSKAALRHRLGLYYYWVESSDELPLELNREIQDILWADWRKLIQSDNYIVSTLYSSEDGFWFLWLSGKLMSEDENIRNRYDELRSDFRKRLDGWNYEYEKSRQVSDIYYCILTVAAMAAEWKGMQSKDRKEAEKFYWFVFEEASSWTRDNMFTNDVMERSLVQIWCRMVLLAVNNPFIEKRDFIWKFISNINCYAHRVNVIDVLFYNIERKELQWKPVDGLRSKLLCMLEAERGILDIEKISDPTYYERYYLNEDDALRRCIEFLNEKY